LIIKEYYICFLNLKSKFFRIFFLPPTFRNFEPTLFSILIYSLNSEHNFLCGSCFFANSFLVLYHFLTLVLIFLFSYFLFSILILVINHKFFYIMQNGGFDICFLNQVLFNFSIYLFIFYVNILALKTYLQACWVFSVFLTSKKVFRVNDLIKIGLIRSFTLNQNLNLDSIIDFATVLQKTTMLKDRDLFPKRSKPVV
jgi:hypothetical protein